MALSKMRIRDSAQPKFAEPLHKYGAEPLGSHGFVVLH